MWIREFIARDAGKSSLGGLGKKASPIWPRTVYFHTTRNTKGLIWRLRRWFHPSCGQGLQEADEINKWKIWYGSWSNPSMFVYRILSQNWPRWNEQSRRAWVLKETWKSSSKFKLVWVPIYANKAGLVSKHPPGLFVRDRTTRPSHSKNVWGKPSSYSQMVKEEQKLCYKWSRVASQS